LGQFSPAAKNFLVGGGGVIKKDRRRRRSAAANHLQEVYKNTIWW